MSVSVTSIYKRCCTRGECKVWLGATSSHGYPYVYVPDRYAKEGPSKSMVSARRLVWERINKKPLPPGRVIVNTCFNRLCLAGAHLVDMTHAEARALAAEAGSYQTLTCKLSRIVNGRSRAAFGFDTADEIRARVKSGAVSQAQLAREHGVDPKVIHNIVYGKSYRRRFTPANSIFHLAEAA